MAAGTVTPYPLVAWSGSWAALAPLIRAQFPRTFGTYYEPMVGGCGVFLGVEHYPAVIGDKNRWLMDTYWALKEDYRRVVAILESLAPTKEVYDRVRRINPYHIDVPFRAAHLIFLTHLSFGAMFRVNRSGQFNVPFAKSKPSRVGFSPARFVYAPENLEAFAARLNGVQLAYGDFVETTKHAQRNDFVYFDPPCPDKRLFGYSGLKGSGAFEFDQQDYLRLAATCISFHRDGVRWAVLDHNTSLLRMYLHNFNVVNLARSQKDNEIEAVLITNYTI